LAYPAISNITKAKKVMWILYCERVIRKGKVLTRAAKLAPAPKATKTAGKAQQTRVEDEANSDKKLAFCSSMLRSISILKF